MCGRYAFMPEDMESGFMAAVERMNRAEQAKITRGDVHPGDTPAAIVMAQGAPEICRMRWGMPIEEEKRLVINARSETAQESAMFSGLIARHRCLLPAKLYYEWTRSAAHTRMKISGGGDLYMAGLFRRAANEPGWEFVVLTQAAGGEVARIHDRMPLLLPDRNSRRQWLRDEGFARRVLENPPGMHLSVLADEPEQLDLFSLIEEA